MAVSMSAALATPWLRASTAPFTSMATVRVTTRPGASSIGYTVRPAAWSSPVASSTAAAGQRDGAVRIRARADLHPGAAEQDPQRGLTVLDDIRRSRTGRRDVRLGRRRAVAVTEPAAAGLAAQPACFHHGALQQRRREPRVVAERG